MTPAHRVGGAALAVVLLVSACTGGKSSGHGTVAPGSRSGASRSASPSGTASPSTGRASEARFFAPKQAREVLATAQRAVQAVNTYDYRHLAADLAAATPLTAGTFRKQYRLTFQKAVPAVGKAHQTQQATVSAIGLGALVKNTAIVFAVGRIRSTSKTVPTGRTTTFGLVGRLTLTDGKWLLSGLTADKVIINASPPGTPGLVASAKAARVAVRTILTLRSASFAADRARALAITAGPLRAQLKAGAAAAQKSVAGGVDLGATVPAVATLRAGGKRAVFVVRAEPYRVAKGKRSAAASQNLQVTMATVRGRWAAVGLTVIG